MNKTHYDPEFKTQAVSLVRDANRPAVEVAKDLGIKASTLYKWLSREKSSKKVSSADLAEIKRLKKELAQANLERDILKKATAYFAKATR